mmetsp:Transcript_35105/g.100836  ORF Transcript_35105/g.100836 Transcript_35105/m.100836 type:complete len:796 (+) Transcript_35105:71-2458(+)
MVGGLACRQSAMWRLGCRAAVPSGHHVAGAPWVAAWVSTVPPLCDQRRAMAGLREKRQAQAEKLAGLPELQRRAEFREQLSTGACCGEVTLTFRDAGLTNEDVRLALDASIATFHLHIESRIANHCGEGFYTIGPCGEELLSGVGLALRPTDLIALHYRHLGTGLMRALRSGSSMETILLNRARGFCVSTLDPVSNGHHCLLGGGPYDFLVTSTLASQSPPAVGRAAGLRLASHLNVLSSQFPPDAVSYVSVGDGSVNNSHFLSATNLAEYMRHRGFQCPVVFAISDNGLCISLRGRGWLSEFVERRLGMPVFRTDGNDLASVYSGTKAAAELARSRGEPVALVFENLSRRFGHAATDRQDAYLTKAEIEAQEAHNALASECARAVEQGVTTYADLLDRFDRLSTMVQDAFDEASVEPKISSREACLRFNSQPRRPTSPSRGSAARTAADDLVAGTGAAPSRDADAGAAQVMRRCMTRALDELLDTRQNAVYIGEDVEHGGYYRITDGLRQKHGWRVADFPPDETSLLGVALGYAQVGLLPVVELPYAKYLDCGADMFFEAVIMNWLSAGQKPSGLILRLQGFDKGVFGGNFHTHNCLHLPPGLDVLAYSNGADYARGLRYAAMQAAAGRVVMLVDSTDLLNRRHLFDKDNAWMRPYPADVSETMDFDEVRLHGDGKDLLIVSYGNGVPTALRARRQLQEEHGVQGVAVVDSPCLSDVPSGLLEALSGFPRVVFADPCKLGQHPHAGLVVKLQGLGLLPPAWRSVAAAPTYNPLGSTVTFLSEDDVVQAALQVLS